MALKNGVRVRETTTTTGTGTLTLAGAVAGFTTFTSEIGATNTCFYALFDANGTAWEIGLGTVATNSLARTSVLRSSNANNAINLTSGTHSVVNCGFPDVLTGFTKFNGYAEAITDIAITSGNTQLTLDLSKGNVFKVAHGANITGVVFSNLPANVGSLAFAPSCTVHVTQDATGGRSITFPASIKWMPSGTAPTPVTTANKTNIYNFYTLDGGTNWIGTYQGSY